MQRNHLKTKIKVCDYGHANNLHGWRKNSISTLSIRLNAVGFEHFVNTDVRFAQKIYYERVKSDGRVKLALSAVGRFKTCKLLT